MIGSEGNISSFVQGHSSHLRMFGKKILMTDEVQDECWCFRNGGVLSKFHAV